MKLNMAEVKDVVAGTYGDEERRVLVSDNPARIEIRMRGETLESEIQPGDLDWLIEALTMVREALRDRTAPAEAVEAAGTYPAGRES